MAKTERKRKSSSGIGFPEVLLAVLIFAGLITVVNCVIRKYETSYRTEQLRSELQEVQNEGERLKVEYQKRLNYTEVSEYAETVLGYKKISEYQIVYMNNDTSDNMEVVSTDTGFADMLSKTFSVVLEYLK